MLLKELRVKYGLTQDELAKKVGVSRSQLAMIETGNSEPSVKLAKKLGEVLETEWTKFFN